MCELLLLKWSMTNKKVPSLQKITLLIRGEKKKPAENSTSGIKTYLNIHEMHYLLSTTNSGIRDMTAD